MNQSIYTERENILPHHAEWLDGCGIKWRVTQTSFKTRSGITEPYIEIFKKEFVQTIDPEPYSTHIPTGTEFCERVAEILGLPKLTFEVDISKKETTTDHIPDIGKKVDE